mmetsp:Transcript_20385/g.46251  ORF Transcript_20385/g.46251 Transcript_20385/m.46251 type:complete len:249 (-) Transcript_20385:1806-2552(-)
MFARFVLVVDHGDLAVERFLDGFVGGLVPHDLFEFVPLFLGFSHAVFPQRWAQRHVRGIGGRVGGGIGGNYRHVRSVRILTRGLRGERGGGSVDVSPGQSRGAHPVFGGHAAGALPRIAVIIDIVKFERPCPELLRGVPSGRLGDGGHVGYRRGGEFFHDAQAAPEETAVGDFRAGIFWGSGGFWGIFLGMAFGRVLLGGGHGMGIIGFGNASVSHGKFIGRFGGGKRRRNGSALYQFGAIVTPHGGT